MKRIKLEDIKREVPYTIPEGYFEKLPSAVQVKIQEHISTKETIFPIQWGWRRSAMVGVAASVIGALIWVTYPQQQGSLSEASLSQVSNDEIVNYLKDNQVTLHELRENVDLGDMYQNEEILLKNLNVSEDDLKKALQNVDLDETI
ncbi:MAG: hypothetical protein R2822_26650 [Spirosomataceae bacterium]